MRKVLSFVLVLTLVLSSFSMAFAADSSAANLSDINGIANEDAIQVAYDLGIVTGNPDGTFLPEKAVTRAEFAAMITRALAVPDSALAGYTSTSFKDTVGYGWAVPYLAFAQSKGIMLGDGAGNAMPGRTITVNEAMTMALRAIGYTANSSILVGAWPANYVSIAQNEDLYDDVASNTTVNKASAAQIIYNLLTVQKVAVNTDGETTYLEKSKDVAANLLNTNLGCTEVEDQILGDEFDYDNSLINITGKLGAFGTAYKNKDGDLVAFTTDSTALTGKVDGGKFKVGDVKYDFATGYTTAPALITNGDVEITDSAITASIIEDFAADNADGGKTVTLNVDLSGKKIKDIYSVVAWAATDADLAASDVQEDIADGALLDEEFVLDDNDDIDSKSFQLLGAASLEDIAEDDVVYVYSDASGDIRKVTVGTKTVEGTVEEQGDDFVTVNGTDYNFKTFLYATAGTAIGDFNEVDAEGIFYLDYDGKIFDFEGTTGTADNYAVVKAANYNEDGFDNAKLKLYLADETTKTLYLADAAADIDWVTKSAATTADAVDGDLVGYSLNGDGEIDTLDVSATTQDVDFQSAKVLSFGGKSYSIDSKAVVFVDEGDGDYSTASLSEVKKGNITNAAILFNEEGTKVVAMLITEDAVDVEDDSVYGVFNDRSNTKNGDDPTFKYVGFINGTSFTKYTDDRDLVAGAEVAGGEFAVYKITVDANDVITKIEVLSAGGDDSRLVGTAAMQITAVNNDKTVVTVGTAKYTIADDAVVYKYADGKFTVSKLSALKKQYVVSLYDTKGDDADGIASVVIYAEKASELE
jgi:hypothetical protein